MNRFALSRSSSVAAPILLLAICLALQGQDPNSVAAKTSPPANTNNNSDLEPVAMQALKIMSQQLQAATTFSFTARITREEPATNGQMLDFFRHIDVQVQRPNKMHLEVKSGRSDMFLWYDGQNVTLMPADAKIYTVIPAPPTIDATLTMLRNKLQAHGQLFPILKSDPYSIMTDGLQSADQVGVILVDNQQFLHLAFREPGADWQLWLSGPNEVLPRRQVIIYKNVEGQPRVTIEYSNWKLHAEIPANAFVFMKPAGAVEANLTAVLPKAGQGGKTK